MNEADFLQVVERRFGHRRRVRVAHQMSFLYKQTQFRDGTVLDIGGGIGLHSFYAISKGASKVTIIEPEGDGGHDQMLATFRKIRADLGDPNVELVQNRFQDFAARGKAFDIVLIQDAINHFDEEACISLHKSQGSVEIYDSLFEQIAALVAPGGHLVLSDCSPRNLFPALGLKNPFDPNIEWHKHQPPSIWAYLAGKNGLIETGRRWSSPARFGLLGCKLLSNAPLSWFFTSHFVLTFQKAFK